MGLHCTFICVPLPWIETFQVTIAFRLKAPECVVVWWIQASQRQLSRGLIKSLKRMIIQISEIEWYIILLPNLYLLHSTFFIFLKNFWASKVTFPFLLNSIVFSISNLTKKKKNYIIHWNCMLCYLLMSLKGIMILNKMLVT